MHKWFVNKLFAPSIEIYVCVSDTEIQLVLAFNSYLFLVFNNSLNIFSYKKNMV